MTGGEGGDDARRPARQPKPWWRHLLSTAVTVAVVVGFVVGAHYATSWLGQPWSTVAFLGIVVVLLATLSWATDGVKRRRSASAEEKV